MYKKAEFHEIQMQKFRESETMFPQKIDIDFGTSPAPGQMIKSINAKVALKILVCYKAIVKVNKL